MSKDFSKAKPTVYRSSGAGRKLSYPPEKETELVQWVLEQRDIQLAVTVQNIIDQVVAIIRPVCPTFKGTRGWAHRFMQRNDQVIRAKTSVAQKLPAALEQKITSFLQAVRVARKEYSYPKELIGNMDETPMYFDMTNNKSVEKKGAKTVSICTTGAEKRHLTVVLAATADGQMLPPMIIFKGKRALKNISVPRLVNAYPMLHWFHGISFPPTVIGLFVYRKRVGWMLPLWSDGSEKSGSSTLNARKLFWLWTPSKHTVRMRSRSCLQNPTVQ